jgi:hypothetical protein
MPKETAVTTLIYPDWFMEEMWDNVSPEIVSTLWEIKSAVTLNFDMSEWSEYQSLKWIAKTNYLREKTLEVIQTQRWKIEGIIKNWQNWYKGSF